MPAFFDASRTKASRHAVTDNPESDASATSAAFTSFSTQHASCTRESARFGVAMWFVSWLRRKTSQYLVTCQAFSAKYFSFALSLTP